MKGYGRKQASFIRWLKEKGEWHPGLSPWRSNSETIRVAESLIKHGDVEKYGFATYRDLAGSVTVIDGYRIPSKET